MARRGLHDRHLVMPALLDETETILRFVATELGPGMYVNMMAQYDPAGRTHEFLEIDRHVHRSAFERAHESADEPGLPRLDERSRRPTSGRPKRMSVKSIASAWRRRRAGPS